MMSKSPAPESTQFPDDMSRVIALAATPTKNFYALACALAALPREERSAVIEIVQQNGISRRRVYYLSTVGAFIRKTSMSKSDTERLGWTKLSILAQHVASREAPTEDEIAKLIALADQSTIYNLRDALLKQAAPEKARSILLHFTPDEYEKLETALIAYGATVRGHRLSGKEAAITAMVKKLNGQL